jgi:hypothetical protein
MTAPPPPQPALPTPPVRSGFIWTSRLLARWLRPKAIAALVVLLASIIKGVLLVLRSLKSPRMWHALGNSVTALTGRWYGWLLWQWRQLKTNPDKRTAALVMIGSFVLPLLLFIGLAQLLSKPAEVETIIDTAEVDETVMAPEPEIITAIPSEEVSNPARIIEQTPAPPTPEPLSASNFTFELFVKRDDAGKLKLLNHVAEYHIRQWYPLGTPANQLMRFFGAVMERSTGSATTSAKQRCLNMNVGKTFTARTVSCTYSHPLPTPLAEGEQPDQRVFWIFALSFDRAGKLTDLRIHARLTRKTD